MELMDRNSERSGSALNGAGEPATAAVGSTSTQSDFVPAAAGLLKAMANENRLLVLLSLQQGELCVGALNDRINLSQSALSQHLAILRELGLVETRRQSQTIFYRLAETPAVQLLDTLQQTYQSA